MQRYYKTQYPIRADQIAYEVFGSVDYTEEIVRLNPRVAFEPIIPSGVYLLLPQKKEKPKEQGVNLWSLPLT